MARDSIVTIQPDLWTELTNANAVSITFQNQSDYVIEIQATTGPDAPDAGTRGYFYPPDQGEFNIKLTDLFPGLTDPKRLWARGVNGGMARVSHA